MESNQEADPGDINHTAFLMPILRLHGTDSEIYINALRFLDNAFKPDGAYGNNNEAHTAASALSAFICAYGEGEIVEKAKEALALFTVQSGDGFAALQGGKRDAVSTWQGAISLGDYKKKECVWCQILNINVDLWEE